MNRKPNSSPGSSLESGRNSHANGGPNSSGPDHDIDRVLRALGAADPSAAMQQRILDSLESAHLQPHRPTSASAPQGPASPEPSRPSLLRWPPAWVGGSAAAIAIAATLLWTSSRKPHNPPVPLRAARESTAPGKAPQPPAPPPRPQAPPPEPVAARPQLTAALPQPSSCCRSERGEERPHVARAAAAAPAENSQAARAQYAHNHPTRTPPAPEAPLTEQERLLLHLARTRTLGDLALLNPEIEAREEAEQAREFASFFPDPEPLPPQSTDPPSPPDAHPSPVPTEKITPAPASPAPTVERKTP